MDVVVQAARRPARGAPRHAGGLPRPLRMARRAHDPGDRKRRAVPGAAARPRAPLDVPGDGRAGRPLHADEGQPAGRRSIAAGAPGRLRAAERFLFWAAASARAVGAARALRLDGARRRRSYPWRSGCCSARSTRSRRRDGSTWRSGSAASWARWPARPSPAGWRAASTRTTCWPHRLPSSSSPLSAPRASSPRAARTLHQEAPVDAAPVPLEVRAVARHPYLARVAVLVLLSTIAFTLGDYVFKSAVAQAVEPAQLGSFFASFYLALNALSLVAQLFLSGWLMRALGVSRALAVLPLLVMPGAMVVAAGAGLAGALLLKTADGALRPSLNRVGIELLFVPVPEALRAAAKPAIDVLGARGGQALASVFILAAVAWGGGNTADRGRGRPDVPGCGPASRWLCGPTTSTCSAPRFGRGRCWSGAALPALDLSSLEALFGALNSRGRRRGARRARAPGRARVAPGSCPRSCSTTRRKPVVLRTLALLSRQRARRLDPRPRTGCWRARTPRSGRPPCARGRPRNPTRGCCGRASQDAEPARARHGARGPDRIGRGLRGGLERAAGAGGARLRWRPAWRWPRRSSGSRRRLSRDCCSSSPSHATSGWPRRWRAPWRRSAARPSWRRSSAG